MADHVERPPFLLPPPPFSAWIIYLLSLPFCIFLLCRLPFSSLPSSSLPSSLSLPLLHLSCFTLSLLCLTLSYLSSLPSSASLNTSPCSLLSSSSLYWTPLLCLILLLFTIVSCLSFALLTLPHMIFFYRHILLMMTATIFWGSILTGSSLSLFVFAPD